MSGTADAYRRGTEECKRTDQGSCERTSQKTNIEKFAKDKGKKATSTEKGSEFEIVIE